MSAVGIEGLSIALRCGQPSLIVTEVEARDLTLMELVERLESDDATRLILILVVTSAADVASIQAAESATRVVAVLPKHADLGDLRRWAHVLVPGVPPRPVA